MNKFVFVLLTSALLAGCTEPMTIAERCASYGYKEGTDKYRDCYADEQRTERIIAEQRRASYKPIRTSNNNTWSNYKPSAIRNGTFSQYWD